MSILPPPSGHDVYWEKWMDAFEEVQEEPSGFPLENEEESYTEGEGEYQDSPEYADGHEGAIPVRGVMTPYGMMPLTDDTLASKKFKFWVGHSNFRLTEDYYGVIGPIEGVETLDILTPYRFRIGVGKMFVDRNVMVDVRNKMVDHVGLKDEPTSEGILRPPADDLV